MSDVSVIITDFNTDPYTVIDLSTLGITLLNSSTIHLLPKVSVRTIKIPGRVGSLRVGSKKQSREFKLDLHLESDSIYNLEILKNTLASLFDPLKGCIELSFSNKPDKYYKVRYSGSSSIREIIIDAQVSIPLKMFDPYIYGQPSSESGPTSINNIGNEYADLIIQVNGPATNPVINLEQSTISYTGSILTGESLVINGETGEVTLGTLNALPALTGDLPILKPGVNSITCSSGTIICSWRPKYSI